MEQHVFGTITLVLWTIQLLPQIWCTFRRKSVKGLSLAMFCLWYSGAMFVPPYSIYLGLSLAIIIQSHTFILLIAICILQYVYYYYDNKHAGGGNTQEVEHSLNDSAEEMLEITVDQNKSAVSVSSPCIINSARRRREPRIIWLRILLTGMALVIVWISIELGMLYSLQSASASSSTALVPLIAICALVPVICTIIGFVPQFYQVIRSRSGKAMSRWFLVLDMLGAVSGMLSILYTKQQTDGVSFNGASASASASGDKPEDWWSTTPILPMLLYIVVASGQLFLLILCEVMDRVVNK